MANLRIVTDNAVGRAASLVASSTAGALAVSNLQVDRKSSVWRAASTAAGLVLRWDDPEEIGAVALPFCNLSPTATMRVRSSVEATAVNLMRYSEQFDQAVWVKQRATVPAGTLNSRRAPDGTMTADKLCNNGIVDASGYISQSFTADGVSEYTGFVFACAGEITTCQIDFTDSVGFVSGARTVVNLLTGAVTTAGSVNSECIALPDGWYLIAMRGRPGASGATFRISLPADSTAGTDGFYIWGGDVKRGGRSSYIPSGASAATRPAGYIDGWQSYDYDSGWIRACPAPALRPRGFTPIQAASAYAHGGGAAARHWLPASMQARGLAIDIRDPDNLQGYIEAACLVVGPVWSPRYNASAASVSVIDSTELSRGASGDQLADPGTISRKVPVDLRALTDADRATFLNLVRNSRAYPMLLSVFPGHADLALERDFTIYGRRTKDSDIAYQYEGRYATTLEIEEI